MTLRDDHAEGETPEVTDNAQVQVPDNADAEADTEVDAEAEADDDDDAGDVDDEDEGQQAHGLKLTPEQQKAFDKAMSRKQRKLREARERAERAERELAEIKSERDALNAKVGDETVLAAMQAAGVLPEYVTAEEAKLVGEVENLKATRRFLSKLVRRGEEYTGQDARGNEHTWTVEELGRQLDEAEDRLDAVGGRAAAIRERIVTQYREDTRLGREARGKAAAKPKGTEGATQKRRAADAAPPAVPPGGGERRSDPSRAKAAAVDWSKVTNREELLEGLEAESRANLKRG
jgi:DNA repair exonuclease SbcCD ATPase subunit